MVQTNSIVKFIILAVALLLAVVMGNLLVTDKFVAFGWVLVGAVAFTCIYLGSRIWLLLPLMGAIELTLRIPGQPNTLLIAQVLVLGFSMLLLLMRKLPFKFSFTELECWLLILTFLVAQAYIRNPVGLNIFGGGTVGGRAYVLFGISILVALLICGMKAPVRDVHAIVKLSIIGGIINFAVNLIGYFVPIVGFWTGAAHVRPGEVNLEDHDQAVDSTRAGRIAMLPAVSRNVSLWVSSFISPLKACFHPLWAPLVLFSVAAAAYSGYRTAVATVALTYFVGLAYRGGIPALLITALGGIAGVVALAAINLIAPLPPNAQRALSFLPGTWEEQYLRDASGSTDWRVEIWREVLTTDRWIENKWLGDGLGFSAQELAYQMSVREKTGVRGMSGFDAHREGILASGDYHSTLVSGIRTSGYIGVFILVIGSIRLAMHAHRLIKRHRYSEHFVVCLFIGIPLISAPLWLFVSASNFTQVATSFVLGIALVRLLQNNLPVLVPATEAARIQTSPVLSRPVST